MASTCSHAGPAPEAYLALLEQRPPEIVVDGRKTLDVDFDVGKLHAGLIPISSDANETSKLFFRFSLTLYPAATHEVDI